MKKLAGRGFDSDARFTFTLSLLTGVATLGLSHCYVLFRVWKQAKNSRYCCGTPSAIAVPGHQLENGNISADYRLRLDRAAALYFESDNNFEPDNNLASGPAMIRIIGGRPHLGISEARAGQQYLIDQGVPGAAITMEEASTNTLENMQHSRDWFAGFDEVVLVSNRYHLERLQTLAKGLNLTTRPCAAEKSLDIPLIRTFKETLFLHWYWSGRVYASLTNNRRMLDKIS